MKNRVLMGIFRSAKPPTKRAGRTTTIQSKDGNCLREEKDILARWTECISTLYSHNASGDQEVLNVPPASNTDTTPIPRAEVISAVNSLKKGKSAGVDNIPVELVQAGGKTLLTSFYQYATKSGRQEKLYNRATIEFYLNIS